MSATVEPRREYGKGHLGNVFIHHFESEDGDRFEVRAGNHTIDTKETLEEAEVIAFALAPPPAPKSKVQAKPPRGVPPAPKAATRSSKSL